MVIDGAWTHALLLVGLPLAAWLALQLGADSFERTDDDSRRQTIMVAAAAAAPGVVLFVTGLSQASFEILTAASSFAISVTAFISTTLIALALIRPTGRFARHYIGVRRLIASTQPASERLARIAHRCRIPARELNVDFPVCILAGLFWPVVIVSKGALKALDDDRLVAALLHERAHRHHGDNIVSTAVDFFADLAFFAPVQHFRRCYRHLREVRADREAALAVGALPLASTLIALAKARPRLPMTCDLADPESFRFRLGRLLNDGIDVQVHASAPKTAAILALVFDFCLAVYPVYRAASYLLPEKHLPFGF